MPDRCPECGGAGRIVTAVTITTLGSDPRTVLVTRQCLGARCQLKYNVFKKERELTEEERRAWKNP